MGCAARLPVSSEKVGIYPSNDAKLLVCHFESVDIRMPDFARGHFSWPQRNAIEICVPMDIQVCLLFSVSSNTVCICKNRSFQASLLSLESLRCPFSYTNLSDCFPWNRFSTASASNTAATVASTSDRTKSTSNAKSDSNPAPTDATLVEDKRTCSQDSVSSNRPRISPCHQDGRRTTS